MPAVERKLVLVTRPTRLEELVQRYHTLAQARFYVEHLGADFGDYEREHATYDAARRTVIEPLARHGRWQAIDRAFLPNFLFGPGDIAIALGQDGLVANTLKYLDGQPLLGVNPDPSRYDGVLLPFAPGDIAKVLPDVLGDRRPVQRITMAKATLPDGQALHAVNDLFIGPRSHTSARYELRFAGKSEVQSSSGVIVSTGLGSTGWMRSIITGSEAIAACAAHRKQRETWAPMPWDAARLVFAVREPFPSRSSAATLVFGDVTAQQSLELLSLMPENGVIFSDGIEADRLEFNAGTRAVVQVADRAGLLLS